MLSVSYLSYYLHLLFDQGEYQLLTRNWDCNPIYLLRDMEKKTISYMVFQCSFSSVALYVNQSNHSQVYATLEQGQQWTEALVQQSNVRPLGERKKKTCHTFILCEHSPLNFKPTGICVCLLVADLTKLSLLQSDPLISGFLYLQ